MKLGQKVLGKKLFGLMMKQTFYGHFVAGEDQERIKPTIGRMQRWDLIYLKNKHDLQREFEQKVIKSFRSHFIRVQPIKLKPVCE